MSLKLSTDHLIFIGSRTKAEYAQHSLTHCSQRPLTNGTAQQQHCRIESPAALPPVCAVLTSTAAAFGRPSARLCACRAGPVPGRAGTTCCVPSRSSNCCALRRRRSTRWCVRIARCSQSTMLYCRVLAAVLRFTRCAALPSRRRTVRSDAVVRVQCAALDRNRNRNRRMNHQHLRPIGAAADGLARDRGVCEGNLRRRRVAAGKRAGSWRGGIVWPITDR